MDGALILVIEDETLLRENIAEIIGHFGFRVISVPTGEEAIKVMKECTPDIIICDIMLPEIDGYEVFARVKQMPKLTHTAFIFLTAKSTRSDTRAGMNMGADDYLTKPFTKEELINSVRARLEKLSIMRQGSLEKDMFVDEAAYEKIINLTKRERKVLDEIAEGYTTPQIAKKLFVSKKTIENHRVNISRKLNLTGPNSLISFALRLKVQNPSHHLPEKQVSN